MGKVASKVVQATPEAAKFLADKLRSFLRKINQPDDSVKVLDNGMVDYSDDLIEPLNKAGMGDVRKEIGDYNSIIDPDYRLNIPDSTQYRGLPEPYDESKTPHLSWTSDNPEYASAYSYGGADKTNTGKGANVTPMSVDVKNPFDFGFRSQFAEVKYGDMLDRLRRGVGDAFKAKKISRDEGLDLIDEIEDLRDSIDNPNEFRPVYSWWNNKPEMVEILKKSKFDGLNAREGIDDNISTVAAFGKNQLRSKLGAALDPAKKNSGNILAGMGGLGVLGGSLYTPDEAEAGTYFDADAGVITNNPVRYKGESVFNISKKGAATPEALAALATTASTIGISVPLLQQYQSDLKIAEESGDTELMLKILEDLDRKSLMNQTPIERSKLANQEVVKDGVRVPGSPTKDTIKHTPFSTQDEAIKLIDKSGLLDETPVMALSPDPRGLLSLGRDALRGDIQKGTGLSRAALGGVEVVPDVALPYLTKAAPFAIMGLGMTSDTPAQNRFRNFQLGEQ